MAEENPYAAFRNDPPSGAVGAEPESSAPGGTNPFAEKLPPNIDPVTRRPWQYAGNIPAGDPVGESTGKPIAEDRAPGFGTQAITSLATDPEQRRRIIAQQLFPDLKPQEAQARIFYGPNGRMAAVGMDGQPYYVDPDRPDFSALRTFSPANLVKNVGTLAGPVLPAAGGIAGGAAAGPASLVVGPLAAAGGAAAGDVARQTLAGQFDPQSERTPYNFRQTAGEGVGAGIGQLLGAGLLHLFSPNRLGLSGPDVRTLQRNPAALQDANRLSQQAETQGVTLTPGQASRLPSLLSHEDVMASGSAGPGTADIAAQFYGQQRNQLNQAYQSYLDRVSSASDKTDAAMQFQQGAEDATRLTRQNANAVARPSYQAAERAGQVMSPDLAQLAEQPAVRDALQAARTDYQNLYRRPAPETPDFALWDLAKRKLDDAHGTAKREGQNTTAMSIDSLRGDVLTHLDAAYPTYATAREASAPGQRMAARLQDVSGSTPGGTLGTERARAIVAPVFEGNNPRAIAEARDAFHAAGRGDEWNAGVRAYLQDAFDTASKSQEGLNPAMLRRQLWSDPNKRAAIEASMTPQQFQGFNNIMETIEAVARSRGMNSLTQPRAAGAAALEDVAGSTAGVRLVRGVSSGLSPRVLNVAATAGDKIASSMTQRNLEKLSEKLFSPDGVALLNQTGLMAPGSQRLVSAVAELFGQQVGGTDVVAGRPPVPGLDVRPPRNRLMATQ